MYAAGRFSRCFFFKVPHYKLGEKIDPRSNDLLKWEYNILALMCKEEYFKGFSVATDDRKLSLV